MRSVVAAVGRPARPGYVILVEIARGRRRYWQIEAWGKAPPLLARFEDRQLAEGLLEHGYKRLGLSYHLSRPTGSLGNGLQNDGSRAGGLR